MASDVVVSPCAVVVAVFVEGAETVAEPEPVDVLPGAVVFSVLVEGVEEMPAPELVVAPLVAVVVWWP